MKHKTDSSVPEIRQLLKAVYVREATQKDMARLGELLEPILEAADVPFPLMPRDLGRFHFGLPHTREAPMWAELSEAQQQAFTDTAMRIARVVILALGRAEVIERGALAYDYYDPMFGAVILDGPNGRVRGVTEHETTRMRAAFREMCNASFLHYEEQLPKEEEKELGVAQSTIEARGGWAGFFEEAAKRIAALANNTGNKPELQGSTTAAFIHGLLEARRVLRELASEARGGAEELLDDGTSFAPSVLEQWYRNGARSVPTIGRYLELVIRILQRHETQLQSLRGEKSNEGDLHALHRSRGQRER